MENVTKYLLGWVTMLTRFCVVVGFSTSIFLGRVYYTGGNITVYMPDTPLDGKYHGKK